MGDVVYMSHFRASQEERRKLEDRAALRSEFAAAAFVIKLIDYEYVAKRDNFYQGNLVFNYADNMAHFAKERYPEADMHPLEMDMCESLSAAIRETSQLIADHKPKGDIKSHWHGAIENMIDRITDTAVREIEAAGLTVSRSGDPGLRNG